MFSLHCGLHCEWSALLFLHTHTLEMNLGATEWVIVNVSPWNTDDTWAETAVCLFGFDGHILVCSV